MKEPPTTTSNVETFPGLWIDGPALIAHDYSKLMQSLESGLATPEHAAFVKDLAERRAGRTS